MVVVLVSLVILLVLIGAALLLTPLVVMANRNMHIGWFLGYVFFIIMVVVSIVLYGFPFIERISN